MIIMSDDTDDRSSEGDDQITLMRIMANITTMMRMIVRIILYHASEGDAAVVLHP